MKFEETDTIELKESLNDTIEKEIVAFLNTNGGTIYIGVKDNGEVIGVSEIDDTLKKLSETVTQRILPNPQEIISVSAKYLEGKFIIEIDIKKGNALYYIKRYGRSATGCYVRVGSTCRSMTEEQINNNFIRTLNVKKPKLVEVDSRRQDLTFEQFKFLLNFRKVYFDSNNFFENFNLLTKEGKFNKMAFLLSDQNDISIKVVRFKGKDKSEFISRQEFGFCCLIKAMNDALDFSLKILNINQSHIEGAIRVDTPLFDNDSFKEAWYNACLHNLWVEDTPPAIYAFDDRIEIISMGNLPEDLMLDDFYKGVSKPINEELAKILIQMHYIDQSGKGVPTIVREYGKQAYIFGKSYIQCIFPYNIYDKDKLNEMFKNEIQLSDVENYKSDPEKINNDPKNDVENYKSDPEKINNDPKNDVENYKSDPEKINNDPKNDKFCIEEEIIRIINENPNISKKAISKILSKSEATIKRAILKSNRIIHIGPAKGGHWEIINNEEN